MATKKSAALYLVAPLEWGIFSQILKIDLPYHTFVTGYAWSVFLGSNAGPALFYLGHYNYSDVTWKSCLPKSQATQSFVQQIVQADIE